jgi:hypothetical protein
MPEEDGTVKINIQEITPLEQARVNFPSLIAIKVRMLQNGLDKAAELQKLFQSKQGDTSVRLKLEKPKDFILQLDVVLKVRPDKEFHAEVERICGPEALEVLAF